LLSWLIQNDRRTSTWVKVYFRKPEENKYTRLDLDGILLNFADAESLKVIKRRTSGTAELESPS